MREMRGGVGLLDGAELQEATRPFTGAWRKPDSDYVIPFGCGRIRREGRDATIVTWGASVYQALEIAKRKELEGRSLEVLDIRSIAPLDEELIYESVKNKSSSYPSRR